MSGIFYAPQFQPVEPPLFNGDEGDVLSIVGGTRQWAPATAPGTPGGYLGGFIADASHAAGGTVAGYQPTGFSATTGRVDILTNNGATLTLSSLGAGTDGQLVNYTNTGPGLIIFSAAGTRLPGDMYVPQNDSLLLCYYAGAINNWCLA